MPESTSLKRNTDDEVLPQGYSEESQDYEVVAVDEDGVQKVKQHGNKVMTFQPGELEPGQSVELLEISTNGFDSVILYGREGESEMSKVLPRVTSLLEEEGGGIEHMIRISNFEAFQNVSGWKQTGNRTAVTEPIPIGGNFVRIELVNEEEYTMDFDNVGVSFRNA